MRSPEAVADERSPGSARDALARLDPRERAARDLADRVRRARPEAFDAADDDERGSGFRLGWTASALLNLFLLGLPIGLVIALPPFLDCRERAERFGLYAGDSSANCTERGIKERLNLLDARLKMLVRGSGR